MLGAVAMLALIAAPCFADAIPLPPGGALVRPDEGLTGTGYSTTNPFSSSYTSVETLNSTFIPYGGIFGSVTSTVYENQTDGTLGFNYLFTRTGGGSDLAAATIGSSATNPWLGVTISNAGAYGTGSSTTGGGTPSWTDGYPITLSEALSGSGIAITWLQGDQGTLLDSPSDHSADIFVVTNAKTYGRTNVGLLDSGDVSRAFALAPSSVPEPTGLVALFGLAGMGLVGLVWRRRKPA